MQEDENGRAVLSLEFYKRVGRTYMCNYKLNLIQYIVKRFTLHQTHHSLAYIPNYNILFILYRIIIRPSLVGTYLGTAMTIHLSVQTFCFCFHFSATYQAKTCYVAYLWVILNHVIILIHFDISLAGMCPFILRTHIKILLIWSVHKLFCYLL